MRHRREEKSRHSNDKRGGEREMWVHAKVRTFRGGAGSEKNSHKTLEGGALVALEEILHSGGGKITR